jgi:hypothetical protein
LEATPTSGLSACRESAVAVSLMIPIPVIN